MVGRKKIVMRAVKIIVSAGLLVVLVNAADWSAVALAAGELNAAWLALSLLLFVPQTVISAWRWQQLVAPHVRIEFVDSLRQTLIAGAWNLIAPAKAGDFSKVAALNSASPATKALAGGKVVVEKLADGGSLFVCMALALDTSIAIAVTSLLMISLSAIGWRDRYAKPANRWLPIVFSTLLLWSLHLLQVHLFLLAAGVPATLLTTLLRVPLALFAGLTPGTFCGVGTRDSALVWLYADVARAATMAVVGLLTSLRYLVPGAAGIAVLAASGWRQLAVRRQVVDPVVIPCGDHA